MGAKLDLLIKGATVLNGLGDAGFVADIGVKDKKIVLLGRAEAQADTVIEGSGLVACPGFIDSHTHADLSILDAPGADNFIMQGVTSVVGGHCGISTSPVVDTAFFDAYMSGLGVTLQRNWATFEEWLSAVEAAETAVNYIPLVGHNSLRGGILGLDFRRPSTAEEIEKLKRELAQALDAGAFGLSAGFDAGTSGHYADRTEILELLRIVKSREALFAPHTRHHQNQWASDGNESAYGLYTGPRGEIFTGRCHGLLETHEYARQVQGIRIMISHITPLYLVPQPHSEELDEALARASLDEIIGRPQAEGIDVSFNVVASEHSIGSELPMIKSFFNKSLALPEWLAKLDVQSFVNRLKSRKFRGKIKAFVNSGKFKFGMITPATDPYWSECYRIVKCGDKECVGKTILELARKRCPDSIVSAIYDEAIEVVCDLLVESPETTWALVKDKREAGAYPVFLKHPSGMPCSDAVAFSADPRGPAAILGIGVPPSAYNMMPRYLATMVKEKKHLSLGEAVRKITSLPAGILGIRDRGVLKEGACADIVLLDWEKLASHDDFEKPNLSPEGIRYVIVNGSIACKDGVVTGARSGRVLRKTRIQ